MKSFALVLPLCLVFSTSIPVGAAEPASGPAMSPVIIGAPPVMDTVQFDLAVEDWVETATAKVTVTVDASLSGADAGKVRTAMQQAVAGLTPDAQWRFTGFDRSTDQSGLETWHAELEARLKETSLGGLADKAKSASKPGMQIKIANIEFTPTLSESEALKAKLRNEIYAQVNDELKRLATAEPERKFRVAEIAFNDGGPISMARPTMMRSMAPGNALAMASMPEPSAPPVTVGQKLEVRAHVVLSAVAPRE